MTLTLNTTTDIETDNAANTVAAIEETLEETNESFRQMRVQS